MELKIGFRGDREKIASMHEKTRPHLSKAYEEFLRSADYSNIQNTLNESLEHGLNAIGEAFSSFYRQYVLSGNITSPLKENTIRAKLRKRRRYSRTLLVDTETMINWIYYEVIK